MQLPCAGVVDVFRATGPELIHWLRGKNALCDYLCDNTIAEAESYASGKAWSRVIWDATAIGYLLDGEQKFMRGRAEKRPVPLDDHTYGAPVCDARYWYIWAIDRDALFTDLFACLAR